MFSSPLSGTFFNQVLLWLLLKNRVVFVPFIGDFFQSVPSFRKCGNRRNVFVPFIGDFFQSVTYKWKTVFVDVFVPFIGDFFQSSARQRLQNRGHCFRPLYRGLFSIGQYSADTIALRQVFSSPLSGTFFNRDKASDDKQASPMTFSSPLSGTFFNHRPQR